MIYEKIHGWFGFRDLYDKVLGENENAVFVEIGTWKGKSASYMAERIMESKKNIKFHTIDTFDMTPDNDHYELIDVDNLYNTCMDNLKPVGSCVNVIRKSSIEACGDFGDCSVDFLFIDGSHRYEDVKKDIESWYPKVKRGGIISGHDYFSPDVKRAVMEFFGKDIPFGSECWFTKK